MRIARVSAAALAVLLVCVLGTIANAQNPLPPFDNGASPTSEDSVVLVFAPQDPDVGGNWELSFTTPAVNPKITTLEIKSASGIFDPGPDEDDDGIGDNCQNLMGDFDVCQPDKIAKVVARGTNPLSFGFIVKPGTTLEMLLADLIVDGSYLPDGDLTKYNDGKGVGVNWVPEPSALALLGLGFIGLLGLRRRS